MPQYEEIRLVPTKFDDRVEFKLEADWKIMGRGTLDGQKFESVLGSEVLDLEMPSKLPNAVWPLIVSSSYQRISTSRKPDWNRIMAYKPTRIDGYEEWDAPQKSVEGLIAWLGAQEAIHFQEKQEPTHYVVVKAAILEALPGAIKLWFDAKWGEPCVEWQSGDISVFSSLSDGQKTMMALVGDIARRCCLLNPQFGETVVANTPGIVLIDEIDTHLHPRWQRRIVGDLKRIFPKVQFIATSHSPFIIQSLEPGELRVLDGGSQDFEYWQEGIEDISEQTMGVESPQRSQRYRDMLDTAEEYFRLLHQGNVPETELKAARDKVIDQAHDMPGDPGLASFLRLKEMSENAKKAKAP